MAKGLWTILNVSNVDKSVEFYKNLGFKAGSEAMGGMNYGSVELTSKDAGIVLWPKDSIAPGQSADTRAWLSGELGKGVLLTLGVPNAQRVWTKAQAARVDVDQPLRAQEWGGQEFTVVDPDGYVVNITDKFPNMTPAKPKRAAKKTAKAKAGARKLATKPKRR